MPNLSLKPGELVPDVIDYSSIHAFVVEKKIVESLSSLFLLAFSMSCHLLNGRSGL
jgi:hypothetical protein